MLASIVPINCAGDPWWKTYTIIFWRTNIIQKITLKIEIGDDSLLIVRIEIVVAGLCLQNLPFWLVGFLNVDL
jgi:hypothetical protein